MQRAMQDEEDPGNSGELMKWFGRDWTANASLRVDSRANSGTDMFVDVSTLLNMHARTLTRLPSWSWTSGIMCNAADVMSSSALVLAR